LFFGQPVDRKISNRTVPTIENCCHFNPLQEIWIGGCYPPEFFSHFDSEVRDIFYHISEITQRDFDNLEKVLSGLGVTVRRPEFSRVDDFLDEQDRLLKPPITPCDFAIVIGQTLYIIPQYEKPADPYQNVINHYIHSGNEVKILDRSLPDDLCYVSFPSYCQIGRDIYMDYDPANKEAAYHTMRVAEHLAVNHRVHVSTTGDHNDSVFCAIKDGHLLSSHYRKNYAESFPGWDIYHHYDTSASTMKKFGTEQKWWLPGVDYAYFNHSIQSIAKNWLGNPQETIFEVNLLVVDSQNVIVSAENEPVMRYFEQLGVQAHIADFESKFFWDAGIHCMVRDIVRKGSMQDYWPERGDNGVYFITEW
jgi:hypothetical protein